MLSRPESIEQIRYLWRKTLLYMWKESDTDVKTQHRVCIKPDKMNSPTIFHQTTASIETNTISKKIINQTKSTKQQRFSRLTPNIHWHNSRSDTSRKVPQQTPMRELLCRGRILVGAFKRIITHPSVQYSQIKQVTINDVVFENITLLHSKFFLF